MRLPKQKLPKRVHKHAAGHSHNTFFNFFCFNHQNVFFFLFYLSAGQSKHKKKGAIEVVRKNTKEEAMDTQPPPGYADTIELTEDEKMRRKLDRKKANAHKVAYKKLNFERTNKKGHRAV